MFAATSQSRSRVQNARRAGFPAESVRQVIIGHRLAPEHPCPRLLAGDTIFGGMIQGPARSPRRRAPGPDPLPDPGRRSRREGQKGGLLDLDSNALYGAFDSQQLARWAALGGDGECPNERSRHAWLARYHHAKQRCDYRAARRHLRAVREGQPSPALAGYLNQDDFRLGSPHGTGWRADDRPR